jgi:16S rRNA (uracil1498-N3)-methyltransferase
MRLREGDEFRVFSGDGREFRATVAGTGRGTLHATVAEIVRQEPPPPLVLEAWIGIVRPNRFDWAVEKCVEAGADIIRPITTDHATRGDGSRTERWDRIAVEAAEQCGRLHVAVVEPSATFDDMVAHHRGTLVLGHPAGESWDKVSRLLPADGRVAVAIGPEGGFSDREVTLARAHGGLVASFGANVLRTETAAVVAVALVRSVAGSR